MIIGINPLQAIHFQSVLASQTSDTSLQGKIEGTQIHHPITCGSKISLDEDGSMSCEHARAAPDHPRTQAVLNASIATLLIELAVQFHEGKLELKI